MKHTLEITKRAHYYHKKAQGSSKGILIVIHGYAQLASDFIEEFENLTEFGYEIFAPEALSKFYNKERTPVTTWMTSHEREDEISDYVNYLETFKKEITKEFKNLPLFLVGFSQGVSTLLRWYASSSTIAAEIHLLAGSIPEELNQLNANRLDAGQYFYYYGTKDRLVRQPQIDIYLKKLEEIGIEATFNSFEGRHEVPSELISHFKILKV